MVRKDKHTEAGPEEYFVYHCGCSIYDRRCTEGFIEADGLDGLALPTF